jgi:hypothetical protein
MEVGQKVWTSTVFSHGHDSPYVYLAERTVIAVIEAGVVVQATNHPTIVVEESKLYPSKAEAAAAAIEKLLVDRQAVAVKYDAEIEKMEKICLQDASVSV